MIICGKKFSIFCSILSVWAIFMLTLLGVLLYSHAIAFLPDLDLELYQKEITNRKILISESFNRYENAVS
jgi:hypothetical protein